MQILYVKRFLDFNNTQATDRFNLLQKYMSKEQLVRRYLTHAEQMLFINSRYFFGNRRTKCSRTEFKI